MTLDVCICFASEARDSGVGINGTSSFMPEGASAAAGKDFPRFTFAGTGDDSGAGTGTGFDAGDNSGRRDGTGVVSATGGVPVCGFGVAVGLGDGDEAVAGLGTGLRPNHQNDLDFGFGVGDAFGSGITDGFGDTAGAGLRLATLGAGVAAGVGLGTALRPNQKNDLDFSF